MVNTSGIIEMCKAGKVQEAYDLARAGLDSMPTDPWIQKKVGWVLYYMIKGDVEAGDYVKLLEHIDELKSLDQLTIRNERRKSGRHKRERLCP